MGFVPFDPSTKRSEVLVRQDDRIARIVKGAPAAVAEPEPVAIAEPEAEAVAEETATAEAEPVAEESAAEPEAAPSKATEA